MRLRFPRRERDRRDRNGKVDVSADDGSFRVVSGTPFAGWGEPGRSKGWRPHWPLLMRRIGSGLHGAARWWLLVFVMTARRFNEHDCVMRAAAIAYFGLISFFPLMLLLIVGSSYVLESRIAQDRVIELMEANVPASVDVIRANIQQVLRARGAISAVAIVTLLFSASAVFSTIDHAMNRIWEVSALRPYWRQKLIALLAIIAIGTMSVLSLTTSAVVSYVKNVILPLLASYWDVSIGPWGVLVVALPYMFSSLLFLIIYRVFPYTDIGWGDVWPGALVAGALWEEAKHLFADYLAVFGRLNLVYGSVGAIVAVLFWFYLTALILLAGAELSAAYTQMRRQREA